MWVRPMTWDPSNLNACRSSTTTLLDAWSIYEDAADAAEMAFQERLELLLRAEFGARADAVFAAVLEARHVAWRAEAKFLAEHEIDFEEEVC